MNFKTCQVMNDNFLLDEKFVPYMNNEKGIKAYVEDSMAKGYVYASLFFYDEVEKEIKKLEKMIRKIQEEVAMDLTAAEPAIVMLEISRRVKDAIGDDSLDALIKQILAEKTKHLSLVPDEKEMEKYQKICESILTELINSIYETAIVKSVEEGDYRTVTISQKFVATLTERQKKLLPPALKMTAFLNDTRLDEFSSTPEFKIRFHPQRLNKPFTEQEEKIKESLKKFMAGNIKN